MRFDLIQSIGLAGDPAIPNDDRAGCRAGRAWVIDGATDLGPAGLLGGQGGAAWLAAEADAALAVAEDAPAAAMLAALAQAMAARFAACRTRPPVARWELPVASLLVARLEPDALDCAWLGDCTGLLRRGREVIRLGPPARLRDREAEGARSMAAHGLGRVKERTGPLLDHLRAARERPDRKVLSVEGLVGGAGSQRLACGPEDELLLMSDGFAALVDGYAALDGEALMAALPTQGLAGLAATLRQIEQDDAACLTYPRFKTSDDATALWLRIA